jgi:hypothetical protein
LANFGEQPQNVPAYRLAELEFAGPLTNHLDGQSVNGYSDIFLRPYQAMWLE